MVPYATTGGLADVMGALPRYLADAGHDVRIFVPFYDVTVPDAGDFTVVIEHLEVKLGFHTYQLKILRDLSNPVAYFVHCPQLSASPGLSKAATWTRAASSTSATP